MANGSIYRKIHGTGPSLLWSHGLMMNSEFESRVGWIDWGTLAKTARVVQYDARGHGRSETAESMLEYRWDRLGEDMLALANEVGAKSFIAGGQSMGAATALYAAAFAPERVRGLVLMTLPTAWELRANQSQNYRRMAERLDKRGIPGIVQLVSLNPAMPKWMVESHPEMSEAAVDAVRRFEVPNLKNVLLGAGESNLPDEERLSRLTMPALILGWTEDPGHPSVIAERLAGILPNSRLHIATQMNDFRRWTRLIRDFITEVGD